MKNKTLQKKKELATEIVELLNGLDEADIGSIYLVTQALYMKQELSKKKEESDTNKLKQ